MVRVQNSNPNPAGGTMIGKTILRSHPPGQNRLGSHPNHMNAATGIRTVTPARTGLKNRVGTKGY